MTLTCPSCLSSYFHQYYILLHLQKTTYFFQANPQISNILLKYTINIQYAMHLLNIFTF